MQDLSIRPVQSNDLPDVLAMAHALAAHHGDVAMLTLETLTRDASGAHPWLHILVAEKDAVLCGYAALCPLAQLQFGVRGMDMHHLFVAQGARQQGVGRALIAGATGMARALQCSYVTVGTHPDNQAAGEVYLAAGFTPVAPPGPRFRIRL
jgi:GNAT superfamily N-acetyltransferase